MSMEKTAVIQDGVVEYQVRRREEIAQERYSKSYSECCWKQKDAINSRITIELDKTVGG